MNVDRVGCVVRLAGTRRAPLMAAVPICIVGAAVPGRPLRVNATVFALGVTLRAIAGVGDGVAALKREVSYLCFL